MIIIGISLFFLNGNIVTTDPVRYDSASNYNQEAKVTITVPKKMEKPVYVYLE